MAHLLTFWGGALNGFNGFSHTPVDYAPKVKVPVLYMLGGADPKVSLEESLGVYNNLPGAKKMVVFEGVGHESYVSKDSLVWLKAVEGFILPRS